MQANAFYGLALAATIIHGVLFDFSFWKIYFIVFVLYLAFYMVTKNSRENPKRKSLMIASWNGKFFVN